MTEFILDRDHPLKAVARIVGILLALSPIIAVILLIK
jgi:hypothetical protein